MQPKYPQIVVRVSAEVMARLVALYPDRGARSRAIRSLLVRHIRATERKRGAA